MSVPDVKSTEDIVNQVIGKDQPIYARESSLADAKSIQGLRAVFDEVGGFTSLLNNYQTYTVVSFIILLLKLCLPGYIGIMLYVHPSIFVVSATPPKWINSYW